MTGIEWQREVDRLKAELDKSARMLDATQRLALEIAQEGAAAENALADALASSSERGVALSLVSGALVDSETVAVGSAMEFGDGIRALTAERDALRADLHAERAKVEQLVGHLQAVCSDYTDVVRTLREVRAVLVRHAGGAVAKAKALIAEALG